MTRQDATLFAFGPHRTDRVAECLLYAARRTAQRQKSSRRSGNSSRNVILYALDHGIGVIDAILARPEHRWLQEGAEEQTERVRREMQRCYGQDGRGS